MAQRSELGVLNHLLETCRDGELGFRFAAQHATDDEIKELFTTLAQQRGAFAQALAPHVHRLGGQANRGGTTAGTIHRGWMNLKEAMSTDHDEVLLGEAERGERSAMHAYQQALEGMLPLTVSDLIWSQYKAISEAQARIVALVNARQFGV